MKNLIAELLIKLAEKDEEYKLQQERLVAMELILSALTESLSPETKALFQEKIERLIINEAVAEDERSLMYNRYMEKIAAIKPLLPNG